MEAELGFPKLSVEFWKQWYCPNFSPKNVELWKLTLPNVIWNIWKECNNRIFRDKSAKPEVMVDKIYRGIFECLNETDHGLAAKEDFNDRWNLSNIKSSKDKGRNGLVWFFSSQGWIKANFDRASKGNPGKASYGGIVRNFAGSCLVAVVGPLGNQTSHYVEASAALNTLIIEKNINHNNLWLEGDSLNIIMCLKGKTEPSWSIENIIFKAREIIASFKFIIIKHGFREQNLIADGLENFGVISKAQSIWYGKGNVNFNIKDLLRKERIMGKDGSHNQL